MSPFNEKNLAKKSNSFPYNQISYKQTAIPQRLAHKRLCFFLVGYQGLQISLPKQRQ